MKFKVCTIPHTMFAAWHLVNQLNELGHKAELVSRINTTDTCMYIIYNPVALRQPMPKNFIVYQTEIATSKWFSNQYLNIISRAIAVWDYSQVNTARYKLRNKNIFIVTPGTEPQDVSQKDIPVTFYGWVETSPRRKRILAEIAKEIPLHIVANKMGNEMWKILRRTKVVLNLHFYDNSPLEVFRINEALSFDCHVVSEPPSFDRYKGLIHFGKDAKELTEEIKKCLNKNFNVPVNKLDNLQEIKAALASLS